MSKKFKKLGVRDDLIRGLADLGIQEPTPIQEQALPILLANGGDFIAQAQTGTGKTAAFGLPLLMHTDTRLAEIQSVVVAPTRELAKQIGKQLFRFTKYCAEKIFIEVLTGGDDIDRQVAALKRPTHAVVVTPGRLVDLLGRRALSLDAVKLLVLDEADEMLSMGFKSEVAQICERTAARRATWLFSATIPTGVQRLITDYMSPDAKVLKVDSKHLVNRDIEHRFMVCAVKDKATRVLELLRKQGDGRGVVFCRTKAGAIELAETLSEGGCAVGVLQGDLPQLERDKVLRSFRKGRFQFLVATDVAARGIDVEGLAFVIHHQLPEKIDQYTHRSGRTGRAGCAGVSIAMIGQREKADIYRLGVQLGVSFTEMRRAARV